MSEVGFDTIYNDKLSGLRKDAKYPNPELEEICYINNCVTNPNMIVGDYSYYDDKKELIFYRSMSPIIMILLATNL